jgi:hypothetical protein
MGILADTTCFSRRAFKVMSDISERWSENNRPFAFRQALAVLLAHLASIRSHDVAKVHRSSGFPLKFVSMVLFELSHNTLWHSCEGYADLVHIIEKRQGVEEFDSVLGQMINSLFEHATDDALETSGTVRWGSRLDSSLSAISGPGSFCRTGDALLRSTKNTEYTNAGLLAAFMA